MGKHARNRQQKASYEIEKPFRIKYNFNHLNDALFFDDTDIFVKAACQLGINFTFGYYLHSACRHKSVGIIKWLLKHPQIDINTRDDCGQTALIYACECKQLFQMLLSDQNIDVNKKVTPMWPPVHCIYSKMFHKTVLNHAINLALYAGNKYMDILKLLINHLNIDINQKSDDSGSLFPVYETMLRKLVVGGKLDIIKLLLAHPNIDVEA